MSQEAAKTPQPTSYDALIKAALQRFYPDLARWLVGDRPKNVEAVETSLAAASVRFTDKLLLLKFERRPDVLLHVEFQAEGDPAMPERMIQYLALILGTLRSPERHPRKPACVVVYLDRKGYREDPGLLELEGELDLKFSLRYRVVKLWEVDPEEILALESPGLLPFLPLLRGNPAELLVESRERILKTPESAAPAETKRELLTILGGLASRVLKDRKLVAKLLSEIKGMGEPNIFFEMIRDEGRAEGLVESRARARRVIERILKRRFGEAAEAARSSLQALGDLGLLESLIEEAAVCPDVVTFLDKVPRS